MNDMTYPSEALALEVASDLSDVVLDHLSELSLVGDSLDPGRELRVPDKGVAVDLLLVGLGEVAVAIGVGEGEVVAIGLNGLPLHCILRCERVEVGVVASNGLLSRVSTAGNLKSAKKSKLIEIDKPLTE